LGREATCQCNWAGTTAEVKALLETNEIILRGEIRRRIPLQKLTNVKVQLDSLCFSVDREPVQLFLGALAAESWAKKVKAPPRSLAQKLGITGKTVVRSIGNITDRALLSALDEAARISAREADLIVACVDTPESLTTTLREAHKQLTQSIPIWLVYRKGSGHPINESIIRSHLRSSGMMDTKVTAVSSEWTALRFNRQTPTRSRFSG
jgi:hypothetical protein